MAAYTSYRSLPMLRRLTLNIPSFSRDTSSQLLPACLCRFVGTIRNKADQMKDGYEPPDERLSGKTKEEVIIELLKQDWWPERPKRKSDDCKEYALQGRASGVDPSIMWPTKEELRQLKEDESYYCSSLEEMQAELHLEKKREELQELREEKHIEKCLADLPRIEEDHRQRMETKRLKEEESKKKKAELLEMARVKLGYSIDTRSPRFKEMVEEMEKEERKKKKALKKKGIAG